MEPSPAYSIHSLHIAERYAIYNAFYQQPEQSIATTANFFGISTNTVRNTLQWQPIPTVPIKRGRKSVLGPQEILHIETATIAKRRITGEQLAQELLELFGVEVSAKTVNRARETSGFSYLNPVRSVFLTPDAMRKRINWCQKQLSLPMDWSRVIFSDESTFEIRESSRKLWRRPGEIGDDVRIHKKAHPQKWMIWGAVGHNYKSSLVFFDGIINSESYIEQVITNSGFIEDAIRAFGNAWCFQQDNATPHVSKTTLNELGHLNVQLLENWPSYSPDLNIIEVIWAIMKDRTEKQCPKTLIDLRKIIEDVWDNISYHTIEKLLDSMPDRCKEIIKNNGLTIAK
jgi:transposase